MDPERPSSGPGETLGRIGVVLGAIVGGLVGLLAVVTSFTRRDGEPRRATYAPSTAAPGSRGAARGATGRPATPPPVAAATEPGLTGHELPHPPLRPGWAYPRPNELPRPTYWPAVLALGIIFLLWGLVTSWIVSAVGLGLLILAAAGWIGDLRHAP